MAASPRNHAAVGMVSDNGIRAGPVLSAVTERSEGAGSSTQQSANHQSEMGSLRFTLDSLALRVKGLAKKIDVMRMEDEEMKSMLLDLFPRFGLPPPPLTRSEEPILPSESMIGASPSTTVLGASIAAPVSIADDEAIASSPTINDQTSPPIAAVADASSGEFPRLIPRSPPHLHQLQETFGELLFQSSLDVAPIHKLRLGPKNDDPNLLDRDLAVVDQIQTVAKIVSTTPTRCSTKLPHSLSSLSMTFHRLSGEIPTKPIDLDHGGNPQHLRPPDPPPLLQLRPPDSRHLKPADPPPVLSISLANDHNYFMLLFKKPSFPHLDHLPSSPTTSKQVSSLLVGDSYWIGSEMFELMKGKNEMAGNVRIRCLIITVTHLMLHEVGEKLMLLAKRSKHQASTNAVDVLEIVKWTAVVAFAQCSLTMGSWFRQGKCSRKCLLETWVGF